MISIAVTSGSLQRTLTWILLFLYARVLLSATAGSSLTGFLRLAGLLLLLHQLIWKKKSFKQGLSHSLKAAMDFISYYE